MGKGTLSVKVFDAGNDKPLSGAQVSITDHTAATLHSLKTDTTGTTPPVSLEAVDRAHSLDPSYTGRAYSTYGMEARRTGYNSLRITDVQIFDGEHAVQAAPLTPMKAHQQAPEQDERVIGQLAIEMGRREAETDSHRYRMTVQAGDTLWALSRRYNTSIAAIQRLNHLTDDRIMTGQVLLIPRR